LKRRRREAARGDAPSKGATLDTGFLIALERGEERAGKLLTAMGEGRRMITVPVVVLAEWWRGSPEQRRLRHAFTVEAMDAPLAETAGIALANVPDATTNDAIVMASAARRDDVVFTSDFEDRIVRRGVGYIRGVKVLSIRQNDA
jgi:predicted nucleic acid-binding protein